MTQDNGDARREDTAGGPWQIRLSETGGVITRMSAPRFEAFWSTGFEDLPALEGFFWSADGADEADTITLYSFTWHDQPPDQAGFEALMHDAVTAIDAWIVQRL